MACPMGWHPAEQYAADVVEGRIPSCEPVRNACERYWRDCETGSERGLVFKPEKAQRVIDFIETMCCHWKGPLAGKPFLLAPWQQFIIWNLFGWYIHTKRDGLRRRFKIIYVEVPRKNGKSLLAAAISLYMLCMDGEIAAEVYSCATSLDQSMEVFKSACKMVEKSPALSKRIRLRTTRTGPFLEYKDSIFAPWAYENKSKRKEGKSTHFGTIDEYHVHDTTAMFDTMRSSWKARPDAMILIITTAGHDKTVPCYTEREWVLKTLRLLTEETAAAFDRYFAIIYTVDAEDLEKDPDLWQKESAWLKAIPGLGVSVTWDCMDTDLAEALVKPSLRREFKCKGLDIWHDDESGWIPLSKWRAAATKIDERKLRGRKCYGGLDLSSKRDLTALAWCFPPRRPGEPYILLIRLWIPGEDLVEKGDKDHAPYASWRDAGHVFHGGKETIDLDTVEEQIRKDNDAFDIVELAYDKWGAEKLAQDLSDHGLTMVEMGQTSAMAEPTTEFESHAIDGKIAHVGNPALTWQVGNAVVVYDKFNRPHVSKEKSGRKIDGLVASIMAFGRGYLSVPKQKSPYKTRGIRCV